MALASLMWGRAFPCQTSGNQLAGTVSAPGLAVHKARALLLVLLFEEAASC